MDSLGRVWCNIMNSTQFAWLYLIENGHANVERSYYGGYTAWDGKVSKYGWNDRPVGVDRKEIPKTRGRCLDEILKHGVDWNKTKAPESDSVSLFTDTFNDPEKKETLVGYLYLKDGSVQRWEADALKVSNVFEMMAAVSEAPAKFVEFFGEKVK